MAVYAMSWGFGVGVVAMLCYVARIITVQCIATSFANNVWTIGIENEHTKNNSSIYSRCHCNF